MQAHDAITWPVQACARFPVDPLITLKAMPQFFGLAGKGM
jgi:hypothetical protein